jgi:hypothetical protein
MDWHYFLGCAAFKALGDLDRAKTYLESELEKRSQALYRTSREQDSFIPWPIYQ